MKKTQVERLKNKIKNLELVIRHLESELNDQTNIAVKNSRYRDLALDFFKCLSECAGTTSAPDVKHWLLRFKDFLK